MGSRGWTDMTRTGDVTENGSLEARDAEGLVAAMKSAAGADRDPVIVIRADAKATHQSVINVMEAARQAGYVRITFATQSRG